MKPISYILILSALILGFLLRGCFEKTGPIKSSVIAHWRTKIEKQRDTVKVLEIRRETLKGRETVVHDSIYLLPDSAALECYSDSTPQAICAALTLQPIHLAQIRTGEEQIKHMGQISALQDSTITEQGKTIQSQAKTINKRSTGLKWAKRGYVALTGLFIYLYIKKP